MNKFQHPVTVTNLKGNKNICRYVLNKQGK